MKFLSTIPRGLVIFLGALALVILIILGFRFFNGSSSTTNTGGNGNSIFSALFPFGNPSSAPAKTNGTDTTPSLSAPQESGAVPVLREVSETPVSGAWFRAGTASTSAPYIRFMDRESGHISETPADAFAETRISNTTMPGIEEVYAISDLALVVRSFVNGTVQNFYGTVNATSSEQSFNALPTRNFDRIALAQNGTMLILTKTPAGSRVEIGKPDGSKMQTLFTSPLSSWVPLSGGSRNFLETAPTAAALGYLYEIKGGTKGPVLQKIAGGAPGFTASVSPGGRYVATSANSANGFTFSVLDTKTGTVAESPIHAFALACAWVQNAAILFCAVPQNPPPAAYPDDWLIGNVSFADQAWIIDSAKNTAYFIGNLTDKNGMSIDATNIAVDSTGSYALFINKKDLSLWSLNISGVIAHAEGK